jgi:uncharacterized protein
MKLFRRHPNVLVVMLKVPIAGKVKTRLAAHIGKKDATKLYRCFIHDIFSGISLLKNIDIIAAYTPRNLISRAKKIVPSGVTVIPQKGRDLGERIQNVFAHLFSTGYKKVAIIGADSPDLPIEYIEKSFLLLKGKTGLVIGPAEDGGYYLIAMSSDTIPSLRKEGEGAYQIFKDIPWGTGTVFKETIEKAKRAGLKSALLPQWYDVDEINTLNKLRENLMSVLPATKTGKMLEKVCNIYE